MTEPRILLRGRIENLDHETTRRLYGRLVLTDHGDHVEWSDGKQTRSWRLPDQPADGLPTLAGIVLARFTSAVGVGQGSDRIIFVDPSGAILAHYSPKRLVAVEIQRKILPPESYQPLIDRGVSLTREEYVTEKAFYSAHPDASATRGSMSLARHPVLWVVGVLVAIIVLVNLILLGTGYYS